MRISLTRARLPKGLDIDVRNAMKLEDPEMRQQRSYGFSEDIR